MKHIHCEVIKAWADGARVEFKPSREWVEAQMPQFNPILEYRVMKVQKLAQVEGWINVHVDGSISGLYATKEKAEIGGDIGYKTIFISEEIEVA